MNSEKTRLQLVIKNLGYAHLNGDVIEIRYITVTQPVNTDDAREISTFGDYILQMDETTRRLRSLIPTGLNPKLRQLCKRFGGVYEAEFETVLAKQVRNTLADGSLTIWVLALGEEEIPSCLHNFGVRVLPATSHEYPGEDSIQGCKGFIYAPLYEYQVNLLEA